MSGCILLPSELKDKIEGIKNLTPQLQGVVYKEFLRKTNNEAALPLGNDDQIKEAIAKFNQFLQQSKQQSGVAQATPSNIEVGDKQEKAKILKEMTVVERIASVQLVSELFSEVTSELKNQLLQSTSAKVNYLKGLPQLSSYQEMELQQAEEVLNSMQSDDRAIFKVYPPIVLFDSQNGGSKTDTFRGVKQRLEQYVNQEVEDIIAQDAQLGRTTTKEEALVRRAMYRKVLDNFDTFARDATPILELTEGIRVKGEDTTDEQAEADAEAKTYDHYMTDFKSVSSYDSMSQSVRRMLRQLNNLDADGNITYNMFGRSQRIRPEVAYIKIMNVLEGMTRADQYIPRLERAAKKEAWINQVINNINNDEQLKTAVYVNFRKQNIHYWTIKNENGEVKTIKLNDDESIQSLLEEWRDSQIGGRQVNGVKAIYTQNGQISKESFNRLTQIAESLTNLLKATNIHTESSWEEGERLIDHEGYLDTILEALQALGIDVNREQLIESISKEQEYDTELHPAARLLTNLTSMYNGMQTRYRSIAGTEIIPNMTSNYNNNFIILAQILSDTKQTIFESSIRTNGKTKYSRVAPNYLSDEVSNLTNDDYYQEHLDKQYKRSSFLYSAENGGTWNNEILQLIEKSDSYRKKFNTRILDSINGKEYDKWTKTQVVKALMTMYLSQPNSTFENKELGIEAGWAYYTLPIYADTQTAEFMSGLRYSNKNNDIADTISNKMVRMILAEYERIQVVKYSKTKEGRVNAPIQNFDGKRGTQFTLIDGLNNVFVQQSTLDLLKSISERTTMDKLKEISGQNLKALQEKMSAGKLVSLEDIMTVLFNSSATKEEINQEIAKYIKEELKGSDDARHSEYGKFLKDLQDQGIITINKGVISVKKEHQDLYMQILGSKLTANQFFEEFFFNNVYATANIIGLTTTDAAFYKSAVDFQKRYKEIHAPGQRLYKDATWNGKKVSDGIERVVYLKDEEVLSNMIKTDSITKALDAQVKAEYLTEAEAEAIKGQYKEVNVTDGQGFRTLNSYRKVAIMSNQWSTVKENAFQRLLNKEWNKFDFDVLFNTFKPYMYTQVFVDRKRADGSTYTAKVPTQHKDSEALLMATMLNGGPMSQSNQLLALEEVMLEGKDEFKDIDLVLFNSGCKVGCFGVIDHNNVTTIDGKEVDRSNYTKDQWKSVLHQELKGQDGKWNPDTVHEYDYDYYSIQNPTPEHLIDRQVIIGTQGARIIQADLFGGKGAITFNVQGKELNPAEWRDAYNKLRVHNIMDSFNELSEKFSTIEGLQKFLLDQATESNNFSSDIKDALKLVPGPNGQRVFNIPLSDATQQKLQQLLTASLKNHVTIQKISGGTAIMQTSWGMREEDKPRVVFNEDGSIKCVECWLTCPSKAMRDLLMEEGSHTLDINKKDELGKYIIPEELRKAIGYRIPTEHKYSMLPIKIKGFLSTMQGSTIILPEDITVIAGSDYDIDKVFLELKAFRKRFDDILGGTVLEERKLTTDINESEFTRMSVENRKARDNAFIDLEYAVLTHPSQARQFLDPGGFKPQEKASRIVEILFNKATNPETNELYTVEELQKLSIKNLNDIMESTSTNYSLISPSTYTQLHQRNMAGASLIGIAANWLTNTMIAQYTELSSNSAVRIEGWYEKSLNLRTSRVKGETYGKLISKMMAEWVAAVVDNGKNPVAAYLGINNTTANMAFDLTRKGYSPLTVGLILRSPSVEYIMNKIDSDPKINSFSAGLNELQKQILSRLSTEARNEANAEYYNLNTPNLTRLLGTTLNEEYLNTLKESGKEGEKQLIELYRINKSLERLSREAEAISTIINSSKHDSQNSASGPFFADTIIQELKVQKAIDQQNQLKPVLNKGIFVKEQTVKEFTQAVKKNYKNLGTEMPLAVQQAAYSLGIRGTEELFKNYVPQFSAPYRGVVQGLINTASKSYISTKDINSIYNDLLSFIFSGEKQFVGENYALQGNMVVNFPGYFQRTVKANKELQDNPLIQNLTVMNATTKVPVAQIVFRNAAKGNKVIRDQIVTAWEALLDSKDPVVRNIGSALFNYFLQRGFNFSPNSPLHMAPASIKNRIRAFKNGLEIAIEQNNSDNKYQIFGRPIMEFIDQYVANHTDYNTFFQMAELNPKTGIGTVGTEEVEIYYKNGQPRKYIALTTEANEYIKFKDPNSSKYIVYKYNRSPYNVSSSNNIWESTPIYYYEVLNKLGVKGIFTEYRMGNEDHGIKYESIISSNHQALIDNQEDLGLYHNELEESIDEGNYVTKTIEENTTAEDNNTNIPEADTEIAPDLQTTDDNGEKTQSCS